MNVRINICITKLYEYSIFEIVFTLQQSEKLQIFSVLVSATQDQALKLS